MLHVDLNNGWQNTDYMSHAVWRCTSLQALQGVYAGTLVLMLLLALFVIIHCPFGIAFFVAVCFLVAVLLYLLGAILALALIAATDVCTNMEPIISIVAPSKYLPVLRCAWVTRFVAGWGWYPNCPQQQFVHWFAA